MSEFVNKNLGLHRLPKTITQIFWKDYTDLANVGGQAFFFFRRAGHCACLFVAQVGAVADPTILRLSVVFWERILLTKVFYLEYIGSMKVKTSITLSEELLKAVDQYAKEYKNRSEFIEEAVRVFIRRLIRRQQDARDLEIINDRADYLNQEAMDVLTYQVDL